MAKPEFFTVRESFVGRLKGVEVEYHKGEVVPASDPAIKTMPLHFEPLLIRGGQVRAVEQATAAPGEKRALAEPEPEPEPPKGQAITTNRLKGRNT